MTAQDTNYEDTNLPVPLCDGIPAAYMDDIKDLFDTWQSVRARNFALTRFYTMHNKFTDLGAVKLPDALRNANVIVGWPKKAVDVMAVRSKFDGFVMAGKRDPALESVVRTSKMKSKYLKAARGSLVHGLSIMAVDGNGDNVKVRSYSANQGCVIWDKAEERPACGVVCSDVDRNGAASRYVVYESDAVLVLTRAGRRKVAGKDHWEWSCEVKPNPIGRPLLEPLVYDPDDDRPLGHSRITPEVIGITEKAMRDVLNMDIAAAFWAFPQRYLLGVERTLFADDVVGGTIKDEDGNVIKLKTRMETYLGQILALTRDENNQIPEVGQFSPLDPGGLIRVFENDAQRFSGATNVPLGQLGVLSNTYTSSDALGAANDPLILDVETMNTHNADSLAEIARMIICARKNCTPDELTDVEKSVEAYFCDPSQPTLSARADGWTKLAAVDSSIVGTRVWYEGLGMTHATIDRLEGEKSSQAATESLKLIAESVAGGQPQKEIPDGPTRRATMYEITSVLGQYKRGQLTRGNAMRMLRHIGVSDEESEILLDEADDDGQVSHQAVKEAANAG